ncbi:Hypothetical Protein FCC1311_050122 [Hondaea fermentalgiana]|uniref:Uncharacterized protein n=1 Tax=Hondaea fermentalgiana TaxID=2315210 RepID=A0A2R5GKI2_9STRA|nr:Hypothetical Protein FCC1311_050122 [Hondaea fermentalgiana]|eukprot:GBG28791.1 Hypothetical Protein FCC1311_050122 [Hondaea fermentalgiana]
MAEREVASSNPPELGDAQDTSHSGHEVGQGVSGNDVNPPPPPPLPHAEVTAAYHGDVAPSTGPQGLEGDGDTNFGNDSLASVGKLVAGNAEKMLEGKEADDEANALAVPPLLRNTRPGTTRSNGERLMVNGEPFSKRRCLCERVDLISINGETPWCRLAEELMGEERHECFDWMVTLPSRGSPGEIRHGINIRNRWLEHLGLTEAMIEGVKDQRIRWTHFPEKCWIAAVNARRELLESSEKRVAMLKAQAAAAQAKAESFAGADASNSQKVAAIAEAKRLCAEADRIQEEVEKPKRTLRRLTWYVDRDEDDSPEDFIMYRRRRDRGELVPKALAMPNVKWTKLKAALQKSVPPASEVLDNLLTRTRSAIEHSGVEANEGDVDAKDSLPPAAVVKRLFGVSADDLEALAQFPGAEERALLLEKDRIDLLEKENEVLRRALTTSRVTFEAILETQTARALTAESRLRIESGRTDGGVSTATSRPDLGGAEQLADPHTASARSDDAELGKSDANADVNVPEGENNGSGQVLSGPSSEENFGPTAKRPRHASGQP